MEYTKQTWTAPTGTGLSRYAKSGETETHVELALDPVNLTNSPTPFTMARMAHMEEGIAKAYDTAPPIPWAQYSGKDLDVIPEIVLDESYHYRHILNNAVIPTPQGLYFNGTSYLRSKEPVTLPDVFTFSATVNCNKKTTTQGIFCIGQYNTPTVPFFWLVRQAASSDNLNILVSNGTTNIPTITFTNFFTGFDNIDVDVKVEIDFVSKTIKAYRNGIQFGSVVSSPTMVKPSSDYAYIGRSINYTEYLLGYMRNICLFDTTLTDTQRNWLAQGNTPPILYDVTNYELGNASKANVRVSLRHGNTFFEKTWAGLTDFIGERIWTDGDNIYYSDITQQFVLNKTTATWVVKTWTGLTDFIGNFIWTDGENIYHSNGTSQLVLNKTTSTWTAKIWIGLTVIDGAFIWTDGENIYFSSGTTQYVLNKTTPTWTAKIWTGLTNFIGTRIWTDGENIYFSSGTTQYVLNKTTSTWVAKTWTGLTDFNGSEVWTDGDNIYFSAGTTQYVLNKATSTWVAKTWTGLTDFIGYNNWTDGENIYYSISTNHYVLPATRHNYVDDAKYNSLFGTVTKCACSTLSDRFVFRNE